MKILILLLALLNGAYMLFDGIYVMLNGKYFGPEKPGPWANFFYKVNVDVYKLGPLFIIFGLLWLSWVYAFWIQQKGAYTFGIVMSVMTLWYLPVGTLFSVIILILLLTAKRKLGL